MSIRNLDALFSPGAVALIGASARKGSLGAVVLDRLRKGGFAGRLELVNPKYDSIGDLPCARSVAALAAPPDLGVIVAPASAAPGIVRELGAAGARAAIVISAGFDAALKRRLLEAARPYLLRILGPNCLGFQVPERGLDASFCHLAPAPGGLALLSQSGAIITAMVDWAAARGVGFSVTASLGDMADIDTGDLLDWLAADRDTKAILLYLEQVTDARKFMSAARAASRVKPVIAVKAGRSAAAARAAASHTGALAGADDVYDAALRRAGIVRVDDLEELFDAAAALARSRPLAGSRLAILTNGGGAGVLAADAAGAVGIDLAALSDATLRRLDVALPRTWSRANPVDIIGDASPERYEAALSALLEEPEADAILVMNCPTGLASSVEAATAVARKAGAEGADGKPVFAAWLGEATAAAGARTLEAAGLPVFRTPAQGVRAVSYLNRHRVGQIQLMRTPPASPDGASPNREEARRIVGDAIRNGRSMLTEPEAKALLAAYGVPTVETRVVASPEEAEAAVEDMLATNRDRNARIAIKILSRDISHKSDVGGVHLDIADPASARIAAAAMLARVSAAAPGAVIDGLVVQPMVRRAGAYELIVGMSCDRVFGPVILFGAGGVSVEVVADRAVSLPPLDGLLAGDMIDQTRIGRLLEGYRDRPAAKREAIIETLMRVAQIGAEMPEIAELDINPLLADRTGVIALDARIVVSPAEAKSRLAIRPYPTEWDRLAGSGALRLRIRPIRPSDERLYPAFLQQVTKEDIRYRFFGAATWPSHERIARFTQIDYARAMAFVAIDEAEGALLGVSRLAADPDYERAEFAILVRSDRQGEGIGRALMRRLVDYARAEGISALEGEVMSENAGMRRLCDAFGFELSAREDGLVRATLRLADGTKTPAP